MLKYFREVINEPYKAYSKPFEVSIGMVCGKLVNELMCWQHAKMS